ncbi:unnamed protein product [Cylicostephanus goldi]|uniref:Heparan sulphate-N-deacetylase deacetylase domain-containing protein n=1 Tax=Cylicostephanus goldi TaxID=71465 RepID=A0A3P6SMQ4_CYLGO|nr:unnamed protein product [Cylicostephanus goldi]
MRRISPRSSGMQAKHRCFGHPMRRTDEGWTLKTSVNPSRSQTSLRKLINEMARCVHGMDEPIEKSPVRSSCLELIEQPPTTTKRIGPPGTSELDGALTSREGGPSNVHLQVLPRQTCGLYTHTQFFHNYPGGFGKLISSIYGGELFFTVLLNPISIFMTHQQNFAHDRLALYTFDSLVRFIRCWTNVKLLWQNPVASAKMYFTLLPQEKVPIWSVGFLLISHFIYHLPSSVYDTMPQLNNLREMPACECLQIAVS